MVERHQMMRGVGYGETALQRPQIGVVSSWGEINPAANHLDKVTDQVKAGIWAAGGTPREFVISSICTSMAGHDNYHLPHRDLVAGYIETVAMTNLFDAMVFVPVCDDVIPGHLMAAARLNLPSVAVTGGYMQLNRYQGEELEPLDVAPKHFGRFKDGEISGSVFKQIQERGCQGGGACPVMGTANTMAAMAEALGLALPGNTCTPGIDSRLMRLAFGAGQQVMRLLSAGIRCSDILSPEAFENAIRVLMALGGSTNAVLHLQAVALERNLDIRPETFTRLSEETPLLCDISPSGAPEHHMGHLDEAGGITAVLKELEPLLSTAVLTATGEALTKTLEAAAGGDGVIIRSADNPLAPDGGLIFLTGNLAPGGALVKKSAVPKPMQQHKGPAKVYADEDAACSALAAGDIKPGQVIIVRHVGPKGDPGMLLLQRFLWQLAARGWHDKVAFLTDGRFSGTNKGCAVAHIAPEASAGGPLAVVEDGDLIEIDIPGKKLELHVREKELARRLKDWTPPDKKLKPGYLSIYSKMATSPDKGAALDYGHKPRY
ncbi:Dihydroxy-acid dehydratase (EC [Olavius algarvensis Delta 1 endosymbiont]|nr:Dihydroxy-acid dehydratase (EC [Olavius algarvensis Delta 1 endosymbiont]